MAMEERRARKREKERDDAGPDSNDDDGDEWEIRTLGGALLSLVGNVGVQGRRSRLSGDWPRPD